MSWAPSEVKPTVSTVLVGGEISSPLHGTEGPSWRGAPEEACREGILYLGSLLCPATAGQWEVVEPGELSPGLPGAERWGKCTLTKPRPRLHHRIQSRRSWMYEREQEWTVRCLSRCKQIHLCLAELPLYQLHHLGVEPPISSPVSTGCQRLYCGPPGCKQLEETTTSLGTTGGFGTPVCKVDVTANPPGDLCRRPPMCCLSGRAHRCPWDMIGNSLEQEIQPVDVPW